MFAFRQVAEVLKRADVAFIVVGGVAAVAHGSSRVTTDVDIVYARDTANLERLVRALTPFHPQLRGAPPGLPFLWDAETLLRGLNFTLATDLGDLDLLGEMAGVGGYKEAIAHAQPKEAYGMICMMLSLIGMDFLRAAKNALYEDSRSVALLDEDELRSLSG